METYTIKTTTYERCPRPYRIVKFGPEPKRFKRFVPKPVVKPKMLIIGDKYCAMGISKRSIASVFRELNTIPIQEEIILPIKMQYGKAPAMAATDDFLRIEKSERKTARERQLREWRNCK